MDSSNCSICSSSDGVECYTKTHDMLRWKSGETVDIKTIGVLESFGEMYVDRPGFFKRIFRGDVNHEELFKKIGDAITMKKEMKKKKMMMMPRSMSVGNIINQRGLDDGIDGLKLERFKVKTPNVIVEPDEQS
ncbi:hypothetical protein ACP275_06G088100 [Erythranthe tilingii]